MKSLKDYTYNIFWSNEDDCWIFKCNEMSGITVCEDTILDALNEGIVVMSAVNKMVAEERNNIL